jgi:ZIP family zinc transporter
MGGQCSQRPYDAGVLEAAAWAGAAASTLVIGAWLGATMDASPRVVGLVMGFGSGALVSSVAFELTEEAFANSGTLTLSIGLAVGALVFFAGDALIDRMGGKQRKHVGGEAGDASLALLLGAALDAIPESLILGLSLVGGAAPPVAFFAAVAVSNVPEGFASAAGARSLGQRPAQIVPRWIAIVAVSAVTGALGYVLVDDPAGRAVAFTQAFGAGALLTMVMDTMAPEAYRDAGPVTGLVAVAGFAFAFLLGQVS